MKELVIASNMIALARSRKGANKRSAMLRMIMPFLSKETGDELAGAIAESNSVKFSKMWDRVKGEIVHKLKDSRPKQLKKPAEAGSNHAAKPHVAPHHKKPHVAQPHKQKHVGPHKSGRKFRGHASNETATAADVRVFHREDGDSVCIDTYGAEKIRINVNGNDLFDGVAPESPANQSECGQTNTPQATVQIDQVDNGVNYVITDEKLIALIKMVCERMFTDADPCPLPRVQTRQVCENHDWEDCPQCFGDGIQLPKGFDFNANILELYDRLSTAQSK